MGNPIKVNVMKPENRKFFQAYWRDPVSGKRRFRSTGETNERKAQRIAVEIENEVNLAAGNATRISWSNLCEQYRELKFPRLKKKTQKTTNSTMNAVQEILAPQDVSQIDLAVIMRFEIAIRKRGGEKATIRRHLSEFRKILNWANRLGYLAHVPHFDMPSMPGAKGRPLTDSEFEKILKAIPLAVGQQFASSWEFMIRGLWLSGLRLEESMQLSYDRTGDLRIDLSVEQPMFWTKSEHDKSKKERYFPAAPEFVELLRAVPECDRAGFVFNPETTRPERPSTDHVGKTISAIGRASQVETKEVGKRIKYASAHDFRRSFGDRWARRGVKAATLKEMMRHASIETTYKYYAILGPEYATQEMWKHHQENSGGLEGSSEKAA